MKIYQYFLTSALSVLLVGGGFEQVRHGRSKVSTAAKAAAPSPQVQSADAAAIQAIARFAEPNAHHQQLLGFVGSWEIISRVWMSPGQAPVETKGSAEKHMVLGGRFLQENFTGTMMATPFVGQGLTGYDNAKKRYVSIWVDTLSTAVLCSEGTMAADDKQLVLTGSGFDPATGQDKSFLQVIHIDSNQSHSFEWFEPGADGKETKLFEVIYTRKN